MGSFRWPHPVSTREVESPAGRWRSRDGTIPKKIKHSPKNYHRSRTRRAKLANQRYMSSQRAAARVVVGD